MEDYDNDDSDEYNDGLGIITPKPQNPKNIKKDIVDLC